MKKRFIFILGLLGAILMINFSLNLNALSMFKENPNDNLNAFRLSSDIVTEHRPFNVVTGTSDIDDLLQNKSFRYVLDEMPKDNWTEPLEFSYQIGYEAPNTTNFLIKSVIEFNDYKFKKMSVYLEIPLFNYRGLFYIVNMVNDSPAIVFRCDADLLAIMEEYDTDYYAENKYFTPTNKVNSLIYKECYQNFDFSFLYGSNYNQYVDGKAKIDVVSDFDNPLKREDITSKIKVSDKKGNANLYLYDGDYGEEDIYDIGVYDLIYYVINDFGNVTKLYFQIEIKDIRGPIIKCDDIILNYKDIVSDEELKKYINITDSSDIKSISYNFDGYKNNPNKAGTFPIIITATDIYDNVSENRFLVTVVDEDAPIITTPSSILSFDNEPLSIDDIKSKISVNDEYDGEITEFKLIDVDNYENKEKGYGRYKFNVEAVDFYGNTATKSFYVNYCNGDYPEVNLDDLIYVLPDNTNIFKNDIEEVLKNLGYLEGSDSIKITSDIKNIDKECIRFTIKVNDDKDYEMELLFIDNDIRVNKFEEIINNDFDCTPIIIGSVIGCVLLASLAMSVIIYKKRH